MATSAFEKLKTFLTQTMRMSHVYQPVIVKRLLESETGTLPIRTLAEDCLTYDEAQVEYYVSIVKRYPRDTLLKHDIIAKESTREFALEGFSELTPNERKELARICDEKTESYIEARDGLIGGHRYNPDPVKSSLRYQVLKASGGKCALCGIHKDDSPIDVDHIIPKSQGGSNELSNLQALCYRCNRGKGNKDNTDFRK